MTVRIAKNIPKSTLVKTKKTEKNGNVEKFCVHQKDSNLCSHLTLSKKLLSRKEIMKNLFCFLSSEKMRRRIGRGDLNQFYALFIKN
jgi:hypothetical protein